MGKFQVDWLNDGEPFEVPPMPLRGHQEVNRLKLERVNVLSRYRQLLFYSQAATVLGIWQMKEKHGQEPARKAWKQAIGVLVHPMIKNDLDWDDEDWEPKFEAWVEDRILPQLEVANVDEGLEKVKEEIDEFGDESEVQALMLDAMEMEQKAWVKEVWWRLKGTFSKIQVPNPDKDEDDEPEYVDEVPFTKENLERHLTYPEDQTRWRQSLGKTDDDALSDKVKGQVLEDAMTLQEEAEIQGN